MSAIESCTQADNVGRHSETLPASESTHADYLRGLIWSERINHDLLNPAYVTNYLNSLKGEFKGQGNVINYAATLLEGAASADIWRQRAAEVEATKNVYDGIIEHALADSVGRYSYQLDWHADERGKLELYSGFKSVREIIANGVDDKTGQIPEFEILRNQQNLNFYDRLVSARTSGRDGVLVEFSPTPLNFDLPEVKDRGYQGNDTIVFYRRGRDGREYAEQKWFPRVDIQQYQWLAQQLHFLGPDDPNLAKLAAAPKVTDLDIMALSGEFNTRQVELVDEFISRHQDVIKEKPSLTAFLDAHVAPKVTLTVMPKLYEIARSITPGMISSGKEYVTRHLESVLAEMELVQFELRLFIKDVLGKDTFTGKTRARLAASGITFDKFTDREDQLEIINSLDYEISGCGFKRDQQTVSLELFGKSSSIVYRTKGVEDFIVRPNAACETCGAWLSKVNTLNPEHSFHRHCPYCNDTDIAKCA